MLAVENQLGLFRAAPQASAPRDDGDCARPVCCAPEGLIGKREGYCGRSLVLEFLLAEDIGAQRLDPWAGKCRLQGDAAPIVCHDNESCWLDELRVRGCW